MAWLFYVIIAVVLAIPSFAIGGVFTVIYLIFGLAALIPSLAIAIRRLRDAGKEWPYIFIVLIPFVGIILYIVALVKPSVPDNGIPTV